MGDVSPLPGLHTETLLEAEEQLQLLCSRLTGAPLPRALMLLDGSFSEWLRTTLGVLPELLFPSVRCGLEVAILSALATVEGLSLSEALLCSSASAKSGDGGILYAPVPVNGLLPHEGSVEEIVADAARLVEAGFRTLKLKVGRSRTPQAEADLMAAIRAAVGPKIHLRCDANRAWSLEDAIDFGTAARLLDIQYIEEPVRSPGDIPRFFEATGMHVALDESVDENLVGLHGRLTSAGEGLPLGAAQGIIALVVKPGRVGGFERTIQLARWARCQGISLVLSSAFESSVGLAAYAQLAAFLDHAEYLGGPRPPLLDHGLATQDRFEFDLLKSGLSNAMGRHPASATHDAFSPVAPTQPFMAIDCRASALLLSTPELEASSLLGNERGGKIDAPVSRIVSVGTGVGDYAFRVMEWAVPDVAGTAPTLLFLHGFLGCAEDWNPVAAALALSCRCIVVDLPAHGGTEFTLKSSTAGSPYSVEATCEALAALIRALRIPSCVAVGYSMGARLALYLTLRHFSQASQKKLLHRSAHI